MYKDRALALPPLNTTLARRMMEQTRDLHRARGRARAETRALAELDQLLVRFSRLVVEQPWIKEIDINPLLASSERLIALDARVIVHGQDAARSRICRERLSAPIRCSTWATGRPRTERRYDPADSSRRRAHDGGFHQRLSERSVYFRYFHL